MDEEKLIKSRLLSEDRIYKKCISKFFDLFSQNAQGMYDEDFDIRDKAWEASIFELMSLQQSLQKQLRVQSAIKKEINDSEVETEDIKQNISQVRDQIESLKGDLEIAKTERKKKLGYDKIALEVMKLQSRDQSYEELDSLKKEKKALKELLLEQEKIILEKSEQLHSIFDKFYETQSEFSNQKILDELSDQYS